MIKRIFSLLICCLLILSCAFTAGAVPYATFARIYDAADLLTPEENMNLNEKLNSTSEEYGCDIVVGTVPYLSDGTIEDYSETICEIAEYGMGETKDCFALFICVESRDWALTPYGNAGAIFTDSKITSVKDAIMPYLSDDNFYEAFDTFADKSEEILKDYNSLGFSIWWVLIALLIGIVIAFIAVLIMKSQLKSVRSQPAANNYLKSDSFNLTQQRDIFIYSTIRRTPKPQSSSSSKVGSSGPGQSGKF